MASSDTNEDIQGVHTGAVTRETRPKTTAAISRLNVTLKLEGYYHEFVDPLRARDHECMLCLCIARTPQQTICGHSACKSCWTDWASQCEENNVAVYCPVDNTLITSGDIMNDIRLKRDIGSLKVYCDNKKRGCDSIFDLYDLEKHLDICKYQVVQCVYSCGETMLLIDLEEHVVGICPRRPSTCFVCAAEMLAQDLEDHDHVCPKKEVLCDTCAETRLLREQVPEHLMEDCQHFATFCSFALFGCTEKILRRDLKNHAEANVVKHVNMLNSAMYDTYAGVGVLKRTLPVAKKDNPELSRPLWDQVPNFGRVESADTSGGSITATGIVNDDNADASPSFFERLQKIEQENENIVAQQILVNDMKEQIEIQKGTITLLQETTHKQSDAIGTLQNEVLHLTTLVSDLSVKVTDNHRMLDQKVKSVDDKTEKIHKQTQSDIAKLHTAVVHVKNYEPYVWTVTVTPKTCALFSNAFHSKNKYRLCLKFIRAELRVLLMAGENDDSLTWPFDNSQIDISVEDAATKDILATLNEVAGSTGRSTDMKLYRITEKKLKLTKPVTVLNVICNF